MTGRFCSTSLLTDHSRERPVGCQLTGCVFDRIELNLTRRDFMNPLVQEWMTESLMCRIANPEDFELVITVTP